MRALLVTLLLILLTTADAAAKRKDDRLVLANGDRMTGEIKRLEQGMLSFKADYMLSAIDVDWRQVQELQSQDEYRVVLSSGRHVIGPIERRPDGSVTIRPRSSGGVPLSHDWSEVLGLKPVEASFWNQLTGNLDSGFSYTSGDTHTQFSASSAVEYLAERYNLGLSGSSIFSRTTDTSTTRNTVEALGQITVRPKWYALGLVSLLSSDQQDLSLRTTVGAAAGRWLVRTEHTNLTIFGGIAYTNEQYAAPPDPSQPGSQVTDNIEGLLGSAFSFVRFKSTSIVSRLTLFPSLTTPGRVRLAYAPTLNLEIAHNLYWSFTLYENYDSKPPVNANKNDFGVTNSIGWKF